MRPSTPPVVVVVLVVAFLVPAAPAAAAGDPAVAAVQLQLLRRGPSPGGRWTGSAALPPTGRCPLRSGGPASPSTESSGRRPGSGCGCGRSARACCTQVCAPGADVLELQFALAEHGFPSGVLDGDVRRPHPDGRCAASSASPVSPSTELAGPASLHALHASPPRVPFVLARPLDAPVTDGFGPRGLRFHAGLDLPAPSGTGVAAVAPGRVTYAGWRAGGWGRLVWCVARRADVRSLFAHLSPDQTCVLRGHVAARFQLGLVDAPGWHRGHTSHFEVSHSWHHSRSAACAWRPA